MNKTVIFTALLSAIVNSICIGTDNGKPSLLTQQLKALAAQSKPHTALQKPTRETPVSPSVDKTPVSESCHIVFSSDVAEKQEQSWKLSVTPEEPVVLATTTSHIVLQNTLIAVAAADALKLS